MLFYLFLFLLQFIVPAGAVCPDGGITYFSDKKHCLYFQTSKTYYLDAEQVCADLGGHLASVHSNGNNMYLSQQALIKFTDSDEKDFWFGANDIDTPKNWTWTDNTIFDFQNWDLNQPLFNISGNDCGAVEMHGGKWISDDCFKQKPYVCEIQAPDALTTTMKPKSCPTGWSYYSTTGYCYIAKDAESWAGAEFKCQNENAHLASVHNLQESLYIADIGKDADIWIGAYTQDKNQHWNYTDGTAFDFPNWLSGEPNAPGFDNCATMVKYAGKFNNWSCDHVTGYVCKKLPS